MTTKPMMMASSDANAALNATSPSCRDMPMPSSTSSVGLPIATQVPRTPKNIYVAELGARRCRPRTTSGSRATASCQDGRLMDIHFTAAVRRAQHTGSHQLRTRAD